MEATHLHILATVTSKGQVTIPKAIRDRLNLEAGQKLIFEAHGDSVQLSKPIDLLDLAGTVKTPKEIEGKPFDEIRAIARAARAREIS